MAHFVHHDLRLLDPAFSSPLLDVLTDLEHLRRLDLQGTTPFPVFVQLKQVFHLLESLASARIEGNHTTLADYVGDADGRQKAVHLLHEAVQAVTMADWRGNLFKERRVRGAIAALLGAASERIDAIFELVKNQREY